jgi:hypothetical protein
LGLDFVGSLLILDFLLELLGAIQIIGLSYTNSLTKSVGARARRKMKKRKKRKREEHLCLEEILCASNTFLLNIDRSLRDVLQSINGELIPGSLSENQEELPEGNHL